MKFTSTPRTRSRGAMITRNVVAVGSDSYGNSYPVISTAQEGTVETMTDFVTKPYVPGVTFVHTPMNRVRTIREFTPAQGSFSLKHPNYTGYNKESGSYARSMDSHFDELRSQFTAIDDENLIAQACTKALANVQKPEAMLLVSLAEFRDTLNSLKNPIQGALGFLARNVPSRKVRRRKKNFKQLKRQVLGSAQDLASQHLTIIFGIQPFLDDINNIVKAIQASGHGTQVLTARGEASRHQVKYKDHSLTYLSDGNNTGVITSRCEAHRTVTVRAFQQYKAELSLLDNLGVSVSDIPKSVWQTQPLSFVVDWLANVSDFIRALTPVPGITYLGSGYTVTSVDACSGNYSIAVTHRDEYGWSGTAQGGTQSLVLENKYRTLVDLKDKIRLVMKSDMHHDTFDTYRIAASISLLTQRLAKRF